MKIPIVNKQDEIVGYKERVDRNPEDIIRLTSIWITDEQGDILLQQRKLTKKNNPGKWGPAVAGTVEEGETYDSNVYKELEEELGIRGINLIKDKKYYGESNTGKRFVQMYTAIIPRNTKLVPQEEEVENLRWVSKDELQKWFAERPEDFVGFIKDLTELFGYEN
ncbi:MAG: NUDIX domain-containing protein [Candidatus Pacebacteria bacterium]|nr:NUDIX domain-containing protein [Candidatus Paceibacterota bacterium]